MPGPARKSGHRGTSIADADAVSSPALGRPKARIGGLAELMTGEAQVVPRRQQLRVEREGEQVATDLAIQIGVVALQDHQSSALPGITPSTLRTVTGTPSAPGTVNAWK